MRINKQEVIEKALTITTSAYTANDVIGGLITFDVSNSGGSGIIRWGRVVDDDAEDAELTLYLFDTSPTAILDAAAFAPTIADLKNMIGKILFEAADYEDINSNGIAIRGRGADAVDIDFKTDLGNIFGYLVCTSTPTYTAVTDLHLTIGVWMDG